MYNTTASGLGSDKVEIKIDATEWKARVGPADPRYLLRPETVESLYILHQITGEDRYREEAWAIFTAIQARCKLPHGYGSYRTVNDEFHREDNVEDSMESYFLAETLKYLYLIFDDSKQVDLRTSVFNTEAHPLPITPGAPTFTPILRPREPADEDAFAFPAPAPPCEDNDTECTVWGEEGECQANPGYMHEMCRKSCRVCP